MLQLNDLVCANVEENGKKVEKSAPFTKTYFAYAQGDETIEREKQFNGKAIGKVTVPKNDPSVDKIDSNWQAMLDFFKAKYEKTDPRLTVLELVTAAYDISERAPASLALRPPKALDEDKVFATTAKNFAAMGGIVDPTTGNKVTEIADITAVLKAMAGK